MMLGLGKSNQPKRRNQPKKLNLLLGAQEVFSLLPMGKKTEFSHVHIQWMTAILLTSKICLQNLQIVILSLRTRAPIKTWRFTTTPASGISVLWKGPKLRQTVLPSVEICNAYLKYSRRLWKSQETNFAMHEDKIMPNQSKKVLEEWRASTSNSYHVSWWSVELYRVKIFVWWNKDGENSRNVEECRRWTHSNTIWTMKSYK